MVDQIARSLNRAGNQQAKSDQEITKNAGKTRFEEEDYPFVSIIMPVRNEGSFISSSLRAVLDQDYPADSIEIIVADGLSTDNTRQIVQEVATQHPNVRLINNPGKIVPTGMNLAIQQAKGDIIIRVDGHCIIQPGYIRLCAEYLSNKNVAGVGGPMETIGETPVAQAIALAMSSPFGVGGSAFRTVKDRTMYVDTVAFPGYRRETIEAAGPYDEELVRNQDDEYNYRLREQGGRILMSSDIRSRYYSRGSFASLLRQYRQYGYWKVRVMQKHPHQMSIRQFVPPAFVAVLGTTMVMAPFFTLARVFLAIISVAYLAANLLASMLTAAKNGWRYLMYLPVAFGALHFGYGMGFLTGLVRFARRWGTGK